MKNRSQTLRAAAIIGLALVLTHQAIAGEPAHTPRITDLAWLAGHWHTTMETGELDEIWSPPAGDCMMGVFRWLRDGRVWIYEVLTIREENGTLMFRFRHFGNDLTAWEPKTDPLTFRLARLTENEAVFDRVGGRKPDRLIFRKKGQDTLTVTLEADTEKGTETDVFRYARR